MRIYLSRVFLACACLALAGCAANFPTNYVKPGASNAKAKAEAKACWNWTLNTPEGQKKARTFKMATYAGAALGGGPAGMLGVAIGNSMQKRANNHDPKKEQYNWQAFNVCMREKGYKAQR